MRVVPGCVLCWLQWDNFAPAALFDAIFLVVMAGVVWWAAVNRVPIGDWVFFLHYQPGPDVSTISQDAG